MRREASRRVCDRRGTFYYISSERGESKGYLEFRSIKVKGGGEGTPFINLSRFLSDCKDSSISI